MTTIDAPDTILSLQTQVLADLIARIPAQLPAPGARLEQILDAIYGAGPHDAPRVALLAVAIAELLRAGVIAREKQGPGYVYRRVSRWATRGLIVMNGMKPIAEWSQLGMEGKAAWLAHLDAIGVRAQASVVAASSRRPVEAVIASWVYGGYLGLERAEQALAIEINAAAGGVA